MTLRLVPMDPAGLVKDDDGYDEPTFTDLTPHKGKAQGPSSSTSDAVTDYVKVGNVELPVLREGLHIPISAPVPKPSRVRGRATEYRVTAVGRSDDPALLNKRYMVVGVPVKSYATARRLDVVEIPAPEED